ncbi:glycosyltransferase [Nocardioides sp.]|uniref:glycosyltransferase n=1 Tax=Nocardioides sp. TaxID=35761 RepID=UPI003D0D208D
MRVLFSSTWGVGHVFPMVPLATAFVAAGHEVRWATNEPATRAVAAAGLDVVGVGLDTAGVREVAGRLRAHNDNVRPQDRAAYAFPHMFGAWAAPVMLPDLLAVATSWEPDLIIHEQAELAAPLVGALLEVDTFTHSFGGAVPAAFVEAAAEQLSELWESHGLDVPRYAGCFAAGYLDICPTSVQTQSLEHVPRRLSIRPEAYTGEPHGELPAIVTAEDRRPLVYLTLGTVFAPVPVLAEAVRGIAALPVRVLVSVGPMGDPAALGDQPDNVSSVTWVQQSEVLRHSAVVVSHAGSGTFLGALALGLPQLCLPQAADQFRNSEAAISTRSGLVLPPPEVSSEQVRDAVHSLLREETYRAGAALVAAEIAAMPAPADVVATLAPR